MNHSEIVSFLWGVADLIRDTLKRGKYQDVIYRYKPPRPLEEIEADIRAIEADIVRMVAEVTGSDLDS